MKSKTNDREFDSRRSDGTTGLVIGAVAGGLLGNAIDGDTLGTLIGGAGGALLGPLSRPRSRTLPLILDLFLRLGFGSQRSGPDLIRDEEDQAVVFAFSISSTPVSVNWPEFGLSARNGPMANVGRDGKVRPKRLEIRASSRAALTA